MLSFDGIIKINDIDLDNILLSEKLYVNNSIYDTAYKTPYGAKLCRIIFDKFDGSFREYNGNKHQALFHSDVNYEKTFDRIGHLFILKSKISDVYSHKYSKIKVNS